MGDLTLGEAAKALGVSVDTLRRWDREGKITTVRDGRNHRRVARSEVERLSSRPGRHAAGDRLSARNRFPGVVLGLFSKRVTTSAILTGLVTGIAIVAVLGLSGHDPFMGINAGFIALCCNIALTLLLTWLSPSKPFSFDLDSEAIPSLSNAFSAE